MNLKPWLACAAVAAFVLGGCGSKDKDAAGRKSGSPTAPPGLEGPIVLPGTGASASEEAGYTALPDAQARRKAIGDALRRGGDVNARDKHVGWTALHWSASDGDVEMIRQLLAARADVDATDLAGKAALHAACESGQVSAVQALLAARANPRLADARGLTPLHYAVLAGNRGIVELLLARRVDVNAATNAGLTPLQMALAGGQAEIADLLRSHGATPVNQPGNEDQTTPPPASMPS